MRRVMESLRAGVEVMHVDGFHCDLSSTPGCVLQECDRGGAVFVAIRLHKTLSNVHFKHPNHPAASAITLVITLDGSPFGTGPPKTTCKTPRMAA